MNIPTDICNDVDKTMWITRYRSSAIAVNLPQKDFLCLLLPCSELMSIALDNSCSVQSLDFSLIRACTTFSMIGKKPDNRLPEETET